MAVTTAMSQSPAWPKAARPSRSWGYADFSCWWSSTWLIEVATREVTTNSAPMAMSMPRWMWAGWRTSSALVVTHSKALKRKTPRATASMNEAGLWPCSGERGKRSAWWLFARAATRRPGWRRARGRWRRPGGRRRSAPRARLEATAAPRSPRIHSAATHEGSEKAWVRAVPTMNASAGDDEERCRHVGEGDGQRDAVIHGPLHVEPDGRRRREHGIELAEESQASSAQEPRHPEAIHAESPPVDDESAAARYSTAAKVEAGGRGDDRAQPERAPKLFAAVMGGRDRLLTHSVAPGVRAPVGHWSRKATMEMASRRITSSPEPASLISPDMYFSEGLRSPQTCRRSPRSSP